MELVDGLDYQEDDERHQNKVEDGGQERTQPQRHRGGDHLAGLVQHLWLQHDVQLTQIDAADEQPDQGHEHVVDQRGGDLAEGGADDHADGHVHHVAAHGKLFEFVEKLLHGVKLLY